MAATSTQAAVRFHISLNVADLSAAVRFYSVLFAAAPAKARGDYAKFELSDPPLVLSLEPQPHSRRGALNHLGFRMPDAAQLVEFQARLEAAGFATKREEGVECCYARQTKFWVSDPDENLWEIYVLEDDIDHRGAGQSLASILPAKPQEGPEPPVWEHRLGDSVSERIPLADNSVAEVALRGTFNSAMPQTQLKRLVAEAYRVLSPGGQVSIHALVADRPFPREFERLSGPAAKVERVPLETEPICAAESAGFCGLSLVKLGASPCFQQDGVEMREMLLHAWKPSEETSAEERWLVYKGPFAQVIDDHGNPFARGRRVCIDGRAAGGLLNGPCADHFVGLATPAQPQSCCSTAAPAPVAAKPSGPGTCG